MKKTIYILIIIVLLIFGGFLLYKKVNFSEREPSIEIDSVENTRFETLKSAILASNDFANSTITSNDTKDVLTIDGKYDIAIKTGYYQMTIKDSKLESTYCKITDAIENSLGLQAGKSIETCEKTLDGSINIGGISAEIYDTYKILTVNSGEPAKLYNIESSHEAGDLISVEEINYNIQIGNYLLTSMNASYKDSTKFYNVCGHIYNKSQKANKEFEIAVYDINKKVIDTKTYKYENTTKKYLPFCVEYPLETNTVQYYSIEPKGESKK